MMEVPIFGPMHIFVDNMSAIHNIKYTKSTLKKKRNSIAYHVVWESVTVGKFFMGDVGTNSNPADLETKVQW